MNFWIRFVFLVAALCMTPLASAQTLSASSYSTCALTRTGGVECWGTGILGNGTTETRVFVPTVIETLASGVAAVGNGEGFGCALTVEGRVLCWGENRGRIGNGQFIENALRPVPVETLGTSVKALAVGINHSCVVTITGGVKCWGIGQYGRLGNGATTPASSPVDVIGLNRGVRSIAAGDWHTCAIKDDGSVWCWGRNHQGQLGDRTTQDRPQPVRVPLFDAMREVQTGQEHTCALSETGEVSCWGGNAVLQLGSGERTLSLTPVPVDIPGPVVRLAAGIDNNSAVTLSGEVYYWGGSRAPTRVSNLPEAATVTLGRYHMCVLLRDGLTMCWGDNNLGQLGNGSSNRILGLPTQLGAPSGVRDVGLGGQMSDPHLCLTAGTSTWCLGNNDRGQLGNGTRADNFAAFTEATPVPANLREVQTGLQHTCARTATGEVYCWGDGSLIGTGATQDALRPVHVTSLAGQTLALTVGYRHACVIETAQKVRCWGANPFGELGDDTKTDRSTPVSVVDLEEVRQVSAGAHFTCALTGAGGVKCWGRNAAGQVGDDTGMDRTLPTDVKGLTSGVASIDVGISHACAVTTAGEVRCWGDNRYGQIGDGTMLNRASPRLVRSLSGQAVEVAVGEEHTCARMSDNRVLCWGRNVEGQLGEGTTRDVSLPVHVHNAPADIVALRAGPRTTCAITGSGAIYCWGQNPVLGAPGSWATTPQQVFGAVDGRAQATATSSFAPTTMATQAFMLPGAVPVGALAWSTGSGILPDSARMVVLPRQSPASEGVWRTWEARVDGGAPGWMARLRLYYDSTEVQPGTDEGALRLFQSTDRFGTARELPVVARDVAANWVEAEIGAGDVALRGWTSFLLAPSWSTGVSQAPTAARDAGVEVYPNPARASGRIVVRLPTAQRIDVAIYDLTGRRQKVLHEGQAPADLSLNFDTTSLPNGAYIVMVTGVGVRSSQLFTVMR